MVKRSYLLFDTDCPRCTDVAKRLEALKVRDLEVRSISDPTIVALFEQSGRRLPGKPALVDVGKTILTVRTGFAMRLRLARMLGARRAADIASMVALEARAHAARRSVPSHEMSRRRLLGGAAGGAGALIFGTAAPAAAQGSASTSKPLGDEARRMLLDSPALQEASAVWGAAVDTAITTAVSADGRNVAMVPHRGNRATFTAIDIDDQSMGITIVFNDNEDGVRYYLAGGAPLAEQVVRDGELVTGPLTEHNASSGNSPEPQGVNEFTVCFVACIGSSVSAECVLACIGCAGGGWGAIINCPTCAICAGPSAIDCANICEPLL